MSCGVRVRGALFYKVSAGSDFLSGSVKNCRILRKWCSKWCSKMIVEDAERTEIGDGEGQRNLIRLNKSGIIMFKSIQYKSSRQGEIV